MQNSLSCTFLSQMNKKNFKKKFFDRKKEKIIDIIYGSIENEVNNCMIVVTLCRVTLLLSTFSDKRGIFTHFPLPGCYFKFSKTY